MRDSILAQSPAPDLSASSPGPSIGWLVLLVLLWFVTVGLLLVAVRIEFEDDERVVSEPLEAPVQMASAIGVLVGAISSNLLAFYVTRQFEGHFVVEAIFPLILIPWLAMNLSLAWYVRTRIRSTDREKALNVQLTVGLISGGVGLLMLCAALLAHVFIDHSLPGVFAISAFLACLFAWALTLTWAIFGESRV